MQHQEEDQSELTSTTDNMAPLAQPLHHHTSSTFNNYHFSTIGTNNHHHNVDDKRIIPQEELGPYDILCGRKKDAFNNIGNRRFRITINMNLQTYENAKSRTEKSVLIASIVSFLQEEAGARFVKPAPKKKCRTGYYIELNPQQAREKVGHALRDMSVARQQRGQGGGEVELSTLTTSSSKTSSPIAVPTRSSSSKPRTKKTKKKQKSNQEEHLVKVVETTTTTTQPETLSSLNKILDDFETNTTMPSLASLFDMNISMFPSHISGVPTSSALSITDDNEPVPICEL